MSSSNGLSMETSRGGRPHCPGRLTSSKIVHGTGSGFRIVAADGSGTPVEMWGEFGEFGEERETAGGAVRGRRTVRQSLSTPIACCSPRRTTGPTGGYWQELPARNSSVESSAIRGLGAKNAGRTKNHEIEAIAHEIWAGWRLACSFWCRSSGAAARPDGGPVGSQRAARKPAGAPDHVVG